MQPARLSGYLFRALGTVAAASLLAVVHGGAVQRGADDLVAHTGEVLHTTAADEHHGVLLQVVADTGDVGRDLHAVDQAHTADLTQSRVRLLGGGGVHAGAHATLLRVALQSRRLLLVDRLLAALADQLVDGRPNLLLLYLPPAVYETTAALLAGFQVRSADTHAKTLPLSERELELYHRV